MDSVFTLPFPEYIVADEIGNHLHRGKGYAVCIPLSRQQKGMDLLVFDVKSRKSISIQVKSSRAYVGRPKKTDPPDGPFDYYLWFRAIGKSDINADYYAFVGIFPKKAIINYSLGRKRSPKNWWSHIILLIPRSDVIKIMNKVKRNSDRFFDIGFDSDLKRVALTRVTKRAQSIDQYLIENSIKGLEKNLRG